jgi:UDP-glucuronate 4-epimerase
MPEKILITGAAGFIGHHTAKALKGTPVIGVDNYDPYYSVDLKKRRAEESGIEIIQGDIADTSFLTRLIESHNVKAIIHLAAQAGVRYSLVNPEAYIQSNIQGFLSVLEAVRQHPRIKLVYASSSSVYGLNEKTPYSVKDRTDRQASLYGVTKKSNELMAGAYHHLFGLDVTGLRFFTVYGPWGRPDMAYYSFTKKIIEGEEIELFNYGECLRDFTYIDDIVEGILAALKLEKGCHIFNLGNHKPVKLSYFVSVLEGLIGKRAKVKLSPMAQGDVTATFADIEESREKLGFKPKVSIEEGLSNFAAWYKDFYQINR